MISSRFAKGVNNILIQAPGDCKGSHLVVSAPKFFKRPFPSPSGVEELRYLHMMHGPYGIVDPAPNAKVLAESMRDEQGLLDPEISLGFAFLGQIIAHDVTANDQFQNGPSTDAENPINLSSSGLDLDNVYGFGPGTDEINYADGIYFKLEANGNDIPRENGVPLITEKRDDVTGVTLQTHIAFKKYHNALIEKYLHRNAASKLTNKQRTWLFEMARNEVIGMYQGIVINEFAPAILGRAMKMNFPKMANIPVEFAAAAYRIGHSLVPNQIQVDTQGTMMTTTDATLRGPQRKVIPWELLIGPNAQKAGRFDDLIAPVMQELLIPLSPTQPELTTLIGGEAQNIGEGSLIDGFMHLNVVETNILRGREQLLPSGEEILAYLQEVQYDPATHGSTDLFVYILKEAAKNGNKYGEVGAFVFESTIAGLIKADKYSFNSRRYSKRDKRRFKRATLSQIVGL